MNKIQKPALAITLMCMLASIPSSRAQWTTNGLAVCDTSGDQKDHQIISDGMGSAFVTWVDDRNNTDIYVQKIDSFGYGLWNRQGAAVCLASFGQYIPQLIPDGEGGAIVTWEDNRSYTNNDIYAQRLDSNGAALWTANGISICSAADNQEDPQITTDGAKGAIIVWQDKRDYATLSYNIYAQRADSAGNIWTPDGVAICTSAGEQENPRVIHDGNGGAIITWMDHRAGPGSFFIYSQRIDESGIPLWPANGVPICTASGSRYNLQIISDGQGGAIFAWQDRRDWYDIYAQRIDADGNTLWAADGAAICIAPEWQAFPKLVSDGSGGAVIVWQDNRDGQWDIYTRRVSSAGDTLWTANGVPLCTLTNDQYNPQIVSDDTGGAILAWEENRTGADPDIYVQRIDSNGNILWTINGVPLCTAVAGQNYPRIASDGSHGAVVAWVDSRNSATNGKDIYVASVDDSGDPKVPTLLESYSTKITESGISIFWTLAEAGENTMFFVSRLESPNKVFHEISLPEITIKDFSYTFIDRSCEAGKTYRYQIEVSDEAGRKILFQTTNITIPGATLVLEQNFPNPFNPGTTIRFIQPSNAYINLSVFDLQGRYVVTLLSDFYSQGQHETEWDGKDATGNPVSSGIYLYRLKVGEKSLTKKMLLIR